MKRQRFFLSFIGGVTIVVVTFAVAFISGYLKLRTQSSILEWTQWAGGVVVAWPLVVLKPVFLNSPNAPSPQSPTAEAFVGMLLFDVVVYSLLIYGALWLRAKWKSHSPKKLGH
jgi:hypothetical protein